MGEIFTAFCELFFQIWTNIEGLFKPMIGFIIQFAQVIPPLLVKVGTFVVNFAEFIMNGITTIISWFTKIDFEGGGFGGGGGSGI